MPFFEKKMLGSWISAVILLGGFATFAADLEGTPDDAYLDNLRADGSWTTFAGYTLIRRNLR
jgi:hypothetical protein